MTDMCVISVRKDTRIRNTDRDEISWPVHGSAGWASLVLGRCRWEEFSNFRGAFTIIIVMHISVSLVSPRAFGVTGESMDEHDAAFGYCEIEAERYKRSLLYTRPVRIDQDRKAISTGVLERLQARFIVALHDCPPTMAEVRNEGSPDLDSYLLSNMYSLHSRLDFLGSTAEHFDLLDVKVASVETGKAGRRTVSSQTSQLKQSTRPYRIKRLRLFVSSREVVA